MSMLTDDVRQRILSLNLVGFVAAETPSVDATSSGDDAADSIVAKNGYAKAGLAKAGLAKNGLAKLGVVKRGMVKSGACKVGLGHPAAL